LSGLRRSRSTIETMIKTKQDILNALDQNRSHLRAQGVRNIGLFGSFVRGEQCPDSDIDLLVEFDPGRKSNVVANDQAH
jgi:uncharacterized protein